MEAAVTDGYPSPDCNSELKLVRSHRPPATLRGSDCDQKAGDSTQNGGTVGSARAAETPASTALTADPW
jgi:hypothetical protein